MTDWNWDVWRDSWYSRRNGTTEFGNGVGPRLQSGFNSGTDDYENRFAISFQEPASFDYGLPVVSATIYLKARGTLGCFSKGSAPKMLIRRFSNPDEVVAENSQGGECILSSAGGASTEWPGPTTTATNQKLWEGDPASGTVISIDVTALFNAWVAAKAGATDKFGLAFWPSNAAGDAEQQSASRKVAFSSADADGDPIFSGGLGPYMKVVTGAPNDPPLQGENSMPAQDERVSGTSREFRGYFLDDDPGDEMSSVHIVVATGSSVDVNGKLNSGVIYDVDSGGSFITGMGPTWSDTRTVSPQTAGATYWWQFAATDTNGPDKGPWSEPTSYVIDNPPVVTKVRPS